MMSALASCAQQRQWVMKRIRCC